MIVNKENIRKHINDLLKEHHTASVQVAFIKDGQIILDEGYGFRDYQNKIPTDSDTIYSVGSSTKAFTGAAIAKLVEEGKLEWDKPVKHYLPDFAMYDKCVTEELSVRDILCHRCGLPRHDLVWYMNQFSSDELIQKLRYLKPAAPFRHTLQYQNLMYALAGYLIEAITGKRWYEYIDEVIVKPLGMENTYYAVADAVKVENRALPHEYTDGEIKPIADYNFTNGSTIGAAGSIISNARNMLKWVDFNLNKGKYNGQQIIAEKEIKECQTPQMINRTMFRTDLAEVDFQSYGFGWFIESFKGYKILHHGGNIGGFSAMVAFVPATNSGFCFLTNTRRTKLQSLLLYTFVDLLLGNEDFANWNKKITAYLEKMEAKMKKEKEDFVASCAKDAAQPLANQAYVGQYLNKAYGEVEVFVEDSQLTIKTPMATIPLKHLCLNTFLAEAEVEGNEIFLPIEFKVNMTAEVTGANIVFEPAIKEGIEFKK